MRRMRILTALIAVAALPLAPASSAAAGSGSTQQRAATAQREISFEWPVDFATGAVPSSAAYNATNGDQALSLPPGRRCPTA